MDTRLYVATQEVIDRVHAYMRKHPESELHKCGKMFGVLVFDGGYLAAFSAKLDGSYHHEGFVPPVYELTHEPIGKSRDESRRLQRLLFANYNFLNGKGESKNLLEIFANETPIIPEDEWFGEPRAKSQQPTASLPPSGAGECCAPKLLQYALTHGLKPLALAEFWIGAPSKTEIRQEGQFYAPCSGRCVPILRHMTQGLEGLQVTGYGLRDTGYGLQVTGYGKPEILFEDEWLMVVNKPAGLLSVPGRSDEPSAESLLHAKAVHRLDQDTSGLLVLAKTPEVYKTLQAYFQRRDILKRYEAVCKGEGLPVTGYGLQEGVKELKSEGEISLPLLPNPYDRPRQMVSLEHGKPAITRYHIREHRPDGTLFVDFYPLTGRTHQLRVHAAHPDGLNAPIVGDRLYNSPMTNYQLPITNRLLLHAAEIRFVHPVTQEEMHFCIPSHF
ncbi:MAG: RluA family pseudouridine synthase [Paludibacteraceae bacterium]|nr:RluA family pseudouridine synthase [Paludibacteraceae bacterium]